MHVVTIASQTKDAGKTTLATNLATLADRPGAPSLLIETDPNGSLKRWQAAGGRRTPLVVACPADEIEAALEMAAANRSIEWVIIEGGSSEGSGLASLVRAATLVLIPTRPGLFDLATVPSTVALARRLDRPFFVALNGTLSQSGDTESPIVTAARRAIADIDAPVWRGSIAHRAAYAMALASGQAVTEFEITGPAADEMRFLWHDVEAAAHAVARFRSAS